MKTIFTTVLSCLLFSAIQSQQTVGMFDNKPGSLDGYVLFSPEYSDTTYLIDKCGRKIHEWSSSAIPGLSVYLLPNGTLFRTENVANAVFNGNGSTGGRLAKYDWNSNLLWSYTLSSDSETQDHDAFPMPNGNILAIVWTYIDSATVKAAGRNPVGLGPDLWGAKLEEIHPIGTDSGVIVWEWNAWDHLIQDYDNTKPNYGVVADHPELLNLNYLGINTNASNDWLHMNGVSYDSALDQIIFSFRSLSEVYILDHSTTTAEAASHSGGRHGKGGDFMYRWGNPQAYDRGTAANRMFYTQHNPSWIPAGYPDSGKIILFNNGLGRPGGNASSADVFTPPIDSAGDYTLVSGQAYGPTSEYWSHMATVPGNLFSMVMGSAQRLPNGNTLICAATTGHFLEVSDTTQDSIWDYINPVDAAGPIAQYTVPTTNESFRCTFYLPTYSGFAGQTLTPGSPIELNPIPNTCGNIVTNNMQVNMAITNVSCHGGNNGVAVAAVSGGVSPYTYLWQPGGNTSNSLGGLNAGTYTLTVTGFNDSTTTVFVTITQPAILNPSGYVIANVSCNGANNGIDSVSVNGGTSPYTYLWSDANSQTTATAVGLSAGTYTVNVSDSCGGSATTSVIVTQPVILNASGYVIANVRCNGANNGIDSVSVNGGTPPYTYLWSDANSQTTATAVGLSAGTYTVNVSDSCGGSATTSVIITQPTTLSMVADSSEATSGNCDGSAWVVVNGGTSPYTYSWTGGLTTDTISNQCAGDYCVMVTDSNGCFDSICVNIDVTTGTNQLKGESEKVKVYPNPNNGIFTIALGHAELVSASQTMIEIYNVLGEVVFSRSLISNSQFLINLSGQPDGVYLYRVLTENGTFIGEGKVVITK